jgi:hypothetical protein
VWCSCPARAALRFAGKGTKLAELPIPANAHSKTIHGGIGPWHRRKPARKEQRLPGAISRYVDAVAEDVLTLDQHITEMDADAPLHSAVAGDCGVPLRRQVLKRQGALDSADHRAKLDQDPARMQARGEGPALPCGRSSDGTGRAQEALERALQARTPAGIPPRARTTVRVTAGPFFFFGASTPLEQAPKSLND